MPNQIRGAFLINRRIEFVIFAHPTFALRDVSFPFRWQELRMRCYCFSPGIICNNAIFCFDLATWFWSPWITTRSISIESDPSSSTNLNILESHAPKVYACKPVSFLRKTSSVACRFLINTMLSHSGGIKWNWFWFSMWRQKAKRKYLNLSQTTYLLGSMLHLNIVDASTFFPQGEASQFCWPQKTFLTYLNSLQVVVVLDGMHCFWEFPFALWNHHSVSLRWFCSTQ